LPGLTSRWTTSSRWVASSTSSSPRPRRVAWATGRGPWSRRVASSVRPPAPP
jgi:hypothetical protein